MGSPSHESESPSPPSAWRSTRNPPWHRLVVDMGSQAARWVPEPSTRSFSDLAADSSWEIRQSPRATEEVAAAGSESAATPQRLGAMLSDLGAYALCAWVSRPLRSDPFTNGSLVGFLMCLSISNALLVS